MPYHRTIAVEFNHCDPAGIVFYPRYFEMINSVVENFFADAIGYPFARMMAEHSGVPTVQIGANFKAPSRLGERLDFTLIVLRVGGASLAVNVTAEGGGALRLSVDLTLVWLAPTGRPAPWPEAIRQGLIAFMEQPT